MEEDTAEYELTDEELARLHFDTWKQLKIDPNAARRFLVEAGWISPRFGVGVASGGRDVVQ